MELDGILQYVTVDTLGSELLADALAGDTVISVEWPVDFGSEGTLVVAGVAYDYEVVDVYTNSITLLAPLAADCAAGEQVTVLTAVAEESEVWKAWVLISDAEQPVPAVIAVDKRRYYQVGDTQVGSVVPLTADTYGRMFVTDAPGRSSVEDALEIPQDGVVRFKGTQVLDDGVTRPINAPTVGNTWSNPATYVLRRNVLTGDVIDPNFGVQRGLFWDSITSRFIHTVTLFGGGIDSTNPATTNNESGLFNVPSNFNCVGGVVRIGTNYYVLGSDGNRSGNWYVYKYNSSFVKQLEWRLIQGGTSPQSPQMCVNGSNLLIAFWTTAGAQNRVVGITYQPDGDGAGNAVQIGSTILCDDAGPKAALTGVYYGSADFGATYLIAVTATSMRAFSVSGTTGTRQTSREWLAPGSEDMRGLAWDGTRFWVLGGSSSKLWKLSQQVINVSRSVTSTQYDSDATGGTHETDASNATTYVQQKRQWLLVTVDPPLDSGGTDDPDSARIYIDNHLQPDLGSGVTQAVYDVPSLVGAGAPTANGFSGVSAPGSILSSAADVLGYINKLLGSGGGRVGPLRWGDDGMRTEQQVGPIDGVGNFTTTAHTLGFVFPVATLAETTLVAPGGGRVTIEFSAYMRAAAAGDELGLAAEVRTGGTIRSGTIVQAANAFDGIHNRNNQVTRAHCRLDVDGLVPGSTYNAYLGVYNATAGSIVNNSRMSVIPEL